MSNLLSLTKLIIQGDYIMEKIRFYNNTTVYKGMTDFVKQHVITIKFDNNIPTVDELSSGFKILNENNDYVQADYNNFTTVYRTYEDDPLRIELSDDSSVYVEPEPIPEPEPYIPTPEELEAIFQQNKINKIALSKLMLAEHLKNNPLRSSAHGGVEGIYSVTSEKQSLMMSQYMTYQIAKSVDPDAKLTWNETGKSCTEWTEEEFLQLILEVKTYVYPLVSRQQQIEEQITNCESQEELDEIVINYNIVSLEK